MPDLEGEEAAVFWKSYAAYNDALLPLTEGEVNFFDQIRESSDQALKIGAVMLLGCMHPASVSIHASPPANPLNTTMDIRATRQRFYKTMLESDDEKLHANVFYNGGRFELKGLETLIIPMVHSADARIVMSARRMLDRMSYTPDESLDTLMEVTLSLANSMDSRLKNSAYAAIGRNESEKAKQFLIQQLLGGGIAGGVALAEATLNAIDSLSVGRYRQEVIDAYTSFNYDTKFGLRNNSYGKKAWAGTKLIKGTGNEWLLMEDLASDEPSRYTRALIHLMSLDPTEAGPIFMNVIRDTNRLYSVRTRALELGIKIDHLPLQELIVEQINKETRLAQSVIRLLPQSRADTTLTLPALRSYMVRNPTFERKYRVACVIRRLGRPDEAARLLIALYPERPEGRLSKGTMLNEMYHTRDPVVIPTFLKVLASDEEALHKGVILHFRGMPDPRATPLIIPFLQHADPHVRGHAAAALGAIGTKEAIEAVLPLLPDFPGTYLADFYRYAYNSTGIKFDRKTKTIVPGTAPWHTKETNNDRDDD